MRPILPCPACSTFLLVPDAENPIELCCPECGHTIDIANLSSWDVKPGSSNSTGDLDAVLASTPYTESRSPALDGQGLADEELQVEGVEDELQLAASETSAQPAKPAFNSVQPITYEQFERMKRKKRSPFWSVAQVILGGLAAIPIALLILWHILGRDVADAGPTVARYIPWIVPERFHPLDMEGEEGENQDTDSKPARERKRGESGFRNFDDVLPPEYDQPEADRASQLESAPAGDAANPPERPKKGPVTASASSGSTEQAESVGALPSSESGGAMSTPSMTIGDLPSRSPHASPNVILQIKSCEQHIEEWRIAVRDGEGDLRSLAQKIYSDLTGIASATQALPEGSPYFRVIRDALQPVSQAIKRQSDLQSLITQGAEHWSRNHDGSEDEANKALAVICKIEQVDETETEWVIQPERENLPESIAEIRIPRSIAPSLLAGQELLLLGNIAEISVDDAIVPNAEGEVSTQESPDDAPSASTLRACYLYAF
ncbi:MAG: hypothetical protein ACE361_14265 [Aureliella sp.]